MWETISEYVGLDGWDRIYVQHAHAHLSYNKYITFYENLALHKKYFIFMALITKLKNR